MIVVVGDALLDRDVEGQVERVCPDSPAPILEEGTVRSRPGGAALAAALASGLAGGSEQVMLLTSWCEDPAGAELASLLDRSGVTVKRLQATGATAEKIRLRSSGQTLLRLDRGGRELVPGPVPAEVAELLGAATAVLVADYGRGLLRADAVRAALEWSRRPVVWDPHPRGSEPVPGCRLVVPNGSELPGTDAATGPGSLGMAGLAARARAACRSWQAGGVAVTLGDKGALLVTADEPPLAVPCDRVHPGDTCGAGDCFAAALTVGLAAGALPSEAVTGAVAAASRFVAAGGAQASQPHPIGRGLEMASPPPRSRRKAAEVAEEVRRAGGTVVAAGGCFDLLHAGHVSMLQAARRLGDCLIVCVNSDRSVRRLKGPGRPLNHQGDRAATLSALDCVDAVEVFEEDTPVEVIRRIRPDIWVKGGDYDGRNLPEAGALADWGGQAVVLPYLAGRSTTGLLERAASPAQ